MRTALTAAAAALLVSCAETEPAFTGPHGPLTGTWRMAAIPSGTDSAPRVVTFFREMDVFTGARRSVWVPDSTAILAHASHSGFGDSLRATVRDQRAWEEAWALLTARQQPQSAPPAVDFDASAVLVVALGARATGGFSIRVDSLTWFEAVTAVHVTSVAPGPRCFTTQALTQPVQMVRIARPVEPIVFVERSVVFECH